VTPRVDAPTAGSTTPPTAAGAAAGAGKAAAAAASPSTPSIEVLSDFDDDF
jgi:hypothetical protein